MKIQATINGIKGQYEIPTSWSQVTFGQFLLLAEAGTSESKILSALIGIDEATLKKAKIKNLDSVLKLLAFLTNSDMNHALPKTIMGWNVPENLELEETGRYEDLKLILSSFPEGQLTSKDLRKYTEICGIYAQPDYMDSTDKDKEEFAKRFLNAPAEEVLAIGNFTVMKLLELKTGIVSPYRKSPTRLKKFRLALTAWLKRLAFTVRLYLWKRKLGLTGNGY